MPEVRGKGTTESGMMAWGLSVRLTGPTMDRAGPSSGTPLTPDYRMAPRCMIRIELVTGGVRFDCVCDDPIARGVIQKPGTMLASGMCSWSLMMNGRTIGAYNLTFGFTKLEKTAEGLRVSCVSSDAADMGLLQAAAERMSARLASGCTGVLLLNNTPICVASLPEGDCGVKDRGSCSGQGSVDQPAQFKSAQPSAAPAETRSRAIVESFHGDQARCLVELHGTTVPVDLPAAALVAHGLTEAMRFEWRMSDGEEVRPDDIRPVEAASLSDAERRDLLRRYQASRDDPAEDVWAELNNH